jgi:hypothetical protein
LDAKSINMKILTISAILAATVLSFASCNKQYDTEVSDSQTNNNNSSNGNGSGSNGSGFNWTGAAPMSAKINGVAFVPTEVTLTKNGTYYTVQGSNDEATFLSVVFPETAIPGKVLSSPNPALLGLVTGSSNGTLNLGSMNGKVKIVTNSATTLEGYFYGDMVDFSGLNGVVIPVTEGYFKVDKP